MSNKLLLDSFTSIFLRVSGAAVNLIFVIFLARKVTHSEAGIFFFCFAVVSFFVLICSFGLDSLILKRIGILKSGGELGDCKQVIYKYFFNVFVFGIGVSFTLFLFVTIFNFSFIDHYKNALIIIVWSIPFLVALNLIASSLQGLGKTLHSVVSNRIVFPLLMLALLFLLDADNSIKLSYLMVVVSTVALFISIIFLKKFFSNLKLSSINFKDFQISKIDISEARALWTSVLFFNILFWSGQIIGGFFLATSDISNLGASQRVAISVSLILNGINMVVAPKYAALFSNGDIEGVSKLSKFSLKLIILGTLPILLSIFIFAEQVMLLFGEEYVKGADILRILVIGEFVNSVCGSVGYILKMSGCARELKKATISAALIAVFLNFVLINFIGVYGCAIAIVVGLIWFNLLCTFFIHQKHNYNPIKFW